VGGADRLAGFVGPLAGLDAALHDPHWKDWVLTCPCDSPFLPLDLAPACSPARAAPLPRWPWPAPQQPNRPSSPTDALPPAWPPFWKAAGDRSGGRGSVVVDFSDCGAFSNINTRRTGPPGPEH
jgi:molybdopterin-guanine dinucleotide biosynthesis protein A